MASSAGDSAAASWEDAVCEGLSRRAPVAGLPSSPSLRLRRALSLLLLEVEGEDPDGPLMERRKHPAAGRPARRRRRRGGREAGSRAWDDVEGWAMQVRLGGDARLSMGERPVCVVAKPVRKRRLLSRGLEALAVDCFKKEIGSVIVESFSMASWNYAGFCIIGAYLH